MGFKAGELKKVQKLAYRINSSEKWSIKTLLVNKG